MDKFIEIINSDFQKLLQSHDNPNYHKFFDSFTWWEKALVSWTDPKEYEEVIKKIDPKQDKYNYDPNIDLSDIKEQMDKCKYIPTKIMSKDKLHELYKIINDDSIKDFQIIRKHLGKMFDYNLPSTISDLDSFVEKVKNNKLAGPYGEYYKGTDIINVIIMGAGPIGLYTALYLNYYYNQQQTTRTYVNILLMDNRIYKEKYKLPYSRLTQFGFDISQLQIFIKNIYCWKSIIKQGFTDRHFDFINTLENLLFVVAYWHNIPIYFTKKYETFDKVKEFAKENNFHYIFDCTGGRLGAHLTADIKWDYFSFKKDNYEVKYVGDNMYKFYVDNKEYKHITVILQLFDKKQRQFAIGNVFGFITDLDDDKIIEKYKNICFKRDDYLKIMRHFKSLNLRYLFFQNLLNSKLDISQIYYIKITTFNTVSHHVNRAAQKIDDNLTYIGLGDTLGNSEYGIYFGLKHAILFSKHVCNLLSTVKYL